MTGMGPTLHIINTYVFMYPNGFMILYDHKEGTCNASFE